VWRDQDQIVGGGNYGPSIVEGIRRSALVMLMCSAASMRSRNVKQEIQLAWRYGKPYLPLLLDDSIGTCYPQQVQYWLEGCQWIEVLDRPPEVWVPAVLRALQHVGAQQEGGASGSGPSTGVAPARMHAGLAGLRSLASYSDQIWPLAAHEGERGASRGVPRGLGAPQPAAQHGYRLGAHVRLAIESEQQAHLLLLDEGPEGIVYCLCPSRFAPDTEIAAGRTILPQPQSPHSSFLVTGVPGREHLVAILADEPLDLDWMPADGPEPARVASAADLAELMSRLRQAPANRWVALATYFDIIA
jgi:hypothetical protein